jgi:dipeptidyl aminopeptidase/acylaminoacyl peptidase
MASDGVDLDGLLILPAGKSRADGPFPLITLVHGGRAEHEFFVYPREGHGPKERYHQIDLLQRTRAWFDRWLSPSAPSR